MHFVPRGSSLDHTALFAAVQLVVHHGGAGTVARCLRAQVPQLIYPLAFDQPYWAQALAQAGAAEVLEEVRGARRGSSVCGGLALRWHRG